MAGLVVTSQMSAGARWAATAFALAALGIGAHIAAAQTSLTLGGVSLGASVLDAVKSFGPPGLVATTDDGVEWRWYDAAGLDIDVLADSSLSVRQILARRPQPLNGVASALVQPSEFPVLERSADEAARTMRSAGAIRLSEPENTISAWNVSSAIVVLELRGGSVLRILALDALAAARLGYVAGAAPPPYRAPRLLRQYAVDYPKRAIERRAEGAVVVKVLVASSGNVKDVTVLVSSGDADIDASELLSMRKSTFLPAHCDEKPCDGIYVDREEYTLAP
jgi:TonB family protein